MGRQRRVFGVSAMLGMALVFGGAVRSIGAAPPPAGDTNSVLILHDSTGPFGWLGEMHALLLGNLLGHFPLTWHKAPVEQYAAGDLSRYRATFYIGATYDNNLPQAFVQDVLATGKPVCWMKYNLARLMPDAAARRNFEARFGFRYEFIDSSGFTNVQYKGETLTRHPADPDLGRTTILNGSIARVHAVAWQNSPSNGVPYIVQASNFWYVGDVPFTYMSEEDRYLAFADALHDIVGIDHPESHRAIIRLEDVDPTYDLDQLRAVTDYLHGESVPFAVATIPVYEDPHGFYNDGVPLRVAMSEAPEFIDTLRYMVARGAQLVAHGYTHQYRSNLNPFTGASGDDYEFFRVVHDANTNVVVYSPVPEDSVTWVQARVDGALREFAGARLRAVAWEPPHYAASALNYRVFATNFPLTIQRVLYFGASNRIAGQFFPYVIHRDFYGQKVMPENLGNVEPEEWFGYPRRLPAEIVRAARKARVVRDGWASAFFHPYLDVGYLREVVEGVKALGYTYVPLAEHVAPTITRDPDHTSAVIGGNAVLRVEAVGSPALRYQWRKNGVNINRATNSLLTLANLRPSDAGAFSVLVTNNFGSALSAEALVTVSAPPLRIQLTNGVVRISFEAASGWTYRLQYRNSLSSGSWTTLRTISGNSGTVTTSDLWAGFRIMRLYRLRAE